MPSNEDHATSYAAITPAEMMFVGQNAHYGSRAGDPTNLQSGCSVNGMELPCDVFLRMADDGVLGLRADDPRGPGTVERPLRGLGGGAVWVDTSEETGALGSDEISGSPGGGAVNLTVSVRLSGYLTYLPLSQDQGGPVIDARDLGPPPPVPRISREQRLITETRDTLINLLNSNPGNNPCAQFFGGAQNAIAALRAIQFTPGRIADYRTGISMEIPTGPVSAGTTYVVPTRATVNTNGGFYQHYGRDPNTARLMPTPNFGGYGSNNNRSRALQMFHELGHVIVTGRNPDGTPQFLLPIDGRQVDPTGQLSERNTRTVLNACRELLNTIRN